MKINRVTAAALADGSPKKERPAAKTVAGLIWYTRQDSNL